MKFYATLSLSLLIVTGLMGQQTRQPVTSTHAVIDDRGIFDVDKSSETWRIVKSDYVISTEELVRSRYKDLGLSSADDLQLYQSDKDQLGFTHSRYQQVYQGIPLRDIIAVFHEKDGRLESISGGIVSGLNLQTSPAASVEDAIAAADQLASEELALQNFRITAADPTQPLVIAMQDEFVRFTPDNFRLCYELELQSDETKGALYIDASTLELVRWESLMQQCNPTTGTSNVHINNTTTPYNNLSFNTVANGSNYDLYDDCRNIKTGSMLYNGNTPMYTNTSTVWNTVGFGAAASLHWSAMKVHDYFSAMHGRNGFDDLGGLMQQFVAPVIGPQAAFTHGAGTGSYQTKCMYGYVGSSYLITMDIVGHEWTHAMNSRSAQLVYCHEAGALNEGFADIFGTMVEFYVEGTYPDFLIAEDATSFGPIRSLSNPLTYSNPDSYLGTNWINDTPKSSYCSASDYYGNMDGNVHNNSGVLNKWFYLLSVGGTHNSVTVSGLWMNDAAAIAYRALNYYLFPYAEFSDARTATVRAAGDLFGVCSINQQQTQLAWDAVQVSPTAVETFKVYAYLDQGVCNNGPHGSCEVFPALPWYSFLWNNGGTSQYNNPLTTGVNTVTVTNTKNGCTSTASVTVNSPAPYPKATDQTAYGDHGRDITSDGSGNVYMVGDFGSQAMLDQVPLSTGEMHQAYGGCSTPATPNAGGFLAKFDPCGNLLWRINSQWVTNMVTTPPTVSFDAIDYGTDDMIYVAGSIEFNGAAPAAHSMVMINGTTHSNALGHPAFYVDHDAAVNRSMFVMKVRANSGIIEWIENDYTVQNPYITTIQRHDMFDRIFIGGKSNNQGFIMEVMNIDGQEAFSPEFPTVFSGPNSVVNDIEISPYIDQVYIAGTIETGNTIMFPSSLAISVTTVANSDAFCLRMDNNLTSVGWVSTSNTSIGEWGEGNDVVHANTAWNPSADVYLIGTFNGTHPNPFGSGIVMGSASTTNTNMFLARLDHNTGVATQIHTMNDASCSWVSGLNVTHANPNIIMSGQFVGTGMTLQGSSNPVSSTNATFAVPPANMWIGAVDVNLNPISLGALVAIRDVNPSGITFNQQDVFSSGTCETDLTDFTASSVYLTNSSFNTGVDLAFCARSDINATVFFRRPGEEEEIITDVLDRKQVALISPNPTSDYLRIQFEENTSGEMVLWDVYGKVVLSQTITESTQQVLDVSTLAAGVYMLNLKMGEHFETHRIIKSH